MYSACSFTGHRQIEKSRVQKLRELIVRAIEYTYNNGCRAYYCGGALGFDTMAALEVIKFKILHPDVRLCLLLPCLNQDAAWKEEQKERYEYVLSCADHTEYTGEEYTKDCMRRRNIRLAESADVIVAYCGRNNSGAAQTVRIAREMGREVFNLYFAAENQG